MSTISDGEARALAAPATPTGSIRPAAYAWSWSVFGVDAVVLAGASVLAFWLRGYLPWLSTSAEASSHATVAAPLMIAGWLMALVVFGSYRPSVFGAGPDEYRMVVKASLTTVALIGVACYLTQFPLSRGYYSLVILFGGLGLMIGRLAVRRTLQRARVRGHAVRRTMIVGSPGHIDDIAKVLTRETWLGYSVVGCLTPSGEPVETQVGVPVLGRADDAAAIVRQHNAEILLIAGGAYDSAAEFREAAWGLDALEDLDIMLAPGLTDVASDRVQVRPVAGLPLVHLEHNRWRHAVRWGKRCFDLVGSLAVIAMVLPIGLLTAAWVYLHDRGPVFFSQVRVGRDGREFRCLKFRSMVTDAEARLQTMAGRSDHVLFKATDDPRITRPGKFIRRFSIDELPQLWNVVRGDMSLVGPRPPLPKEVAAYPPQMVRRLNVRPGLTGLWQVSGRSDLSWEDTMRLDLYYVDNWSMIQDLLILIRTARAVVASRGAY